MHKITTIIIVIEIVNMITINTPYRHLTNIITINKVIINTNTTT